jgi:hypothetical protein
MAITSRVDSMAGVIEFTAAGKLSRSHLESALAAVYAESEGVLPANYLWDLRNSTIEWSTDQVREFVHWVLGNRPEGESCNAIVASTDLQFGLARMYEALTSELPVNVMVFREMDAARSWLAETRRSAIPPQRRPAAGQET